MSSLTNPTIKTVFGDWEDVYSVQQVTKDTWTEDLPLFHEDTTYYRTFGGGPEGGYFVKGDAVWRATRSLYQPWRVDKLKNCAFEYEPADEMAGKTARCRRLEVYSILETRTIVDEHLLWGNAIEIYKCLRDGLSPKADASYKDLCLGIILDQFCQIDKYLDILPPDSCGMTKQNLINLNETHKKDEERESVESDSSDSESQDDLELQEAYREGKKDGYEQAKAECEECQKTTEVLHPKCDNTEAQGVSFVCATCVEK
jgi:hypothetical protein